MPRELVHQLAVAVLLFGLACTTAAEDDGPTKEEAAEQTADGKFDWTLDWCEIKGWYDDGDCDWFCPRRDAACNAEPLGPEPTGFATRHPIVLAHGFDASPTNRWGFFEVAEALTDDGHEVIITSVPPYNSAEVRAAVLADQIRTALSERGADKVNIIAHSMGGLDARVVASTAGEELGDRIASITTISSPHRGTVIADVALGILPGATDKLINTLAKAWGVRFSDFADDTNVRAALESLSEQRADSFAADFPDHPSVHYQSWAGITTTLGLGNVYKWEGDCQDKLLAHDGTQDRADPTLSPMSLLMTAMRGAHDGMATVDSAIYGDFLGCIPADHLDQVGQIKDHGADPHTGFDHLRFYRNMAFDLERAGF